MESLLLSNSSAPVACVLFPVKILGFQPPHHFYKGLANWLGLFLSPSLQNPGPQAPMYCSFLDFYLVVMSGCAIPYLSACIKKYPLSNTALPQFQNSLASSQSKVTQSQRGYMERARSPGNVTKEYEGAFR